MEKDATFVMQRLLFKYPDKLPDYLRLPSSRLRFWLLTRASMALLWAFWVVSPASALDSQAQLKAQEEEWNALYLRPPRLECPESTIVAAEALALAEKIGPSDSLAVLNSLVQLGREHWRCRTTGSGSFHIDAAEKARIRALIAAERKFGPTSSDAAHRTVDLAYVYRYKNQDNVAAPMLARALDILLRDASYYDYYTVAALADMYVKLGEYAKVEQLYRLWTPRIEAGFGSNHSLHAYALERLAGAVKETQGIAQAEPIYMRALVIVEGINRANGSDLKFEQRLLEKLADIKEARGATTEALTLRQRSATVAAQQASKIAGQPTTGTTESTSSAAALPATKTAQGSQYSSVCVRNAEKIDKALTASGQKAYAAYGAGFHMKAKRLSMQILTPCAAQDPNAARMLAQLKQALADDEAYCARTGGSDCREWGIRGYEVQNQAWFAVFQRETQIALSNPIGYSTELNTNAATPSVASRLSAQACRAMEQTVRETRVPANASVTASTETVMFMTKTAMDMFDGGCPGITADERRQYQESFTAAERACNQVQTGGRRCVPYNHSGTTTAARPSPPVDTGPAFGPQYVCNIDLDNGPDVIESWDPVTGKGLCAKRLSPGSSGGGSSSSANRSTKPVSTSSDRRCPPYCTAN